MKRDISVKSFLNAYCPPFLKPAMRRIENSPLAYRLARGVFWSMVGALISRGLMLVAFVLVARMLGKIGYGELGMVQSTVGMLGEGSVQGSPVSSKNICRSHPRMVTTSSWQSIWKCRLKQRASSPVVMP